MNERDDQQVNFAEAAAGLGAALKAMENHLQTLNESIRQAKLDRKASVDESVSRLLPDLSTGSMGNLRQDVPEFVDGQVLEAFAQNRKFLGIFPKPGYGNALAVMQTRLAYFIDKASLWDLKEFDAEINKLEAEKTDLNAKQSEAMELLRLLEKGSRANVILPAETREEINAIAERARTLSTMRTRAGATPQQRRASPAYADSGSSDADIWIYMLTDIPTSLRTVMFSAFFGSRHDEPYQGGGGTSGGAGASGDFSNDPQGAPNAADTTASSAAVAAAIATDDRLGTFS